MNSPSLRLILTATLLLAALACRASAASDGDTAAAVAAAKAWLGLVDSGKYAESWKEAAPFFQEKVAEADWIKMLESVRKPLGDVKSRELMGSQYMTSLPGAPAGEYVVMQFKTSFESKPEAVETVTPMKDPKGVWRVSGYFIK